MVTLCTYQDVLDELPVGHDTSVSTSQAWVERLITAIEGEICLDTRKDWVTYIQTTSTSSATLTAGKLKTATVAGTCKKIINYNLRGFSPQRAGEIHADIFHDIYNSYKRDLKDVDITKIRTVSE